MSFLSITGMRGEQRAASTFSASAISNCFDGAALHGAFSSRPYSLKRVSSNARNGARPHDETALRGAKTLSQFSSLFTVCQSRSTITSQYLCQQILKRTPLEASALTLRDEHLSLIFDRKELDLEPRPNVIGFDGNACNDLSVVVKAHILNAVQSRLHDIVDIRLRDLLNQAADCHLLFLLRP